MSSFLGKVFPVAAAMIDSDATTPVYFAQRGFASTAITRTGAGDVTLTLADAMDTTDDALVSLTVYGSALHTGSVQLASASTLRVRTNTIAATPTVVAADLDFGIKVERLGVA